MDPTKKKELSRKRRQNHQSLDGTEKKKLLHKRKEKFQSMDATKKKELFQKRTEKYESMDTEAKRDILNKEKEKRESKSKPHLLNHVSNSLRGKEEKALISYVLSVIEYLIKISNEAYKQQVPLPNIFQYSTII